VSLAKRLRQAAEKAIAVHKVPQSITVHTHRGACREIRHQSTTTSGRTCKVTCDESWEEARRRPDDGPIRHVRRARSIKGTVRLGHGEHEKQVAGHLPILVVAHEEKACQAPESLLVAADAL
jgi:hypothetical protein